MIESPSGSHSTFFGTSGAAASAAIIIATVGNIIIAGIFSGFSFKYYFRNTGTKKTFIAGYSPSLYIKNASGALLRGMPAAVVAPGIRAPDDPVATHHSTAPCPSAPVTTNFLSAAWSASPRRRRMHGCKRAAVTHASIGPIYAPPCRPVVRPPEPIVNSNKNNWLLSSPLVRSVASTISGLAPAMIMLSVLLVAVESLKFSIATHPQLSSPRLTKLLKSSRIR